MVEKIATTDSLTGIYNRHYLNQKMAKLPLQALEQQKTNLVFFILQIDWFKNYVDYYGFEKGDELLKTVSKLVVNQLKNVNGTVYRVGGSQFAGTSIDKDITKTLTQINEIEILLNELAIPHALSMEKIVHVSIGIVIYDQFQQFDFNELYKKADRALYQAFETQNHKAIVIDKRHSN
ncbi:MAG TPA: diguanylate cyclase [Thiomicrospira sp.]|jgi:diguanylate cyclase (GGDEF)-like protein|nr:diguanylate cyclase [Thiomicrospira sp.]